MSFLAILFALLGFTVDVQPTKSTVPDGVTQTDMGGVIAVGGVPGDTDAEMGGMIEVGG